MKPALCSSPGAGFIFKDSGDTLVKRVEADTKLTLNYQ